MSLLLATAILAAGGLGLYMYKSPDEPEKGAEEYNEENLFLKSVLNGSVARADNKFEMFFS